MENEKTEMPLLDVLGSQTGNSKWGWRKNGNSEGERGGVNDYGLILMEWEAFWNFQKQGGES